MVTTQPPPRLTYQVDEHLLAVSVGDTAGAGDYLTALWNYFLATKVVVAVDPADAPGPATTRIVQNGFDLFEPILATGADTAIGVWELNGQAPQLDLLTAAANALVTLLNGDRTFVGDRPWNKN